MYRLLAYLIAPLASCIFNNARTIPVYHDVRVVSTFRETIKMLDAEKNVLIFPEKNEKCNNIIYKFQENFVDTARMYYRKTGRELSFVPMYIAPKLRRAYFGKPTVFDSKQDIAEEKKRIVEYLSEEITKMGRELPRHTVVPYRNIGRRNYLTNKDVTEVPK